MISELLSSWSSEILLSLTLLLEIIIDILSVKSFDLLSESLYKFSFWLSIELLFFKI